MINAEKKNLHEWNTVIGNAAKGTKYQGLFKRVNKLLMAPSRKRGAVSLYKLNKYTKEGDNVLVPKKVLSTGKLEHKINISALEYSSKAVQELKSSGSKIVDVKEMIGKEKIHLIV